MSEDTRPAMTDATAVSTVKDDSPPFETTRAVDTRRLVETAFDTDMETPESSSSSVDASSMESQKDIKDMTKGTPTTMTNASAVSTAVKDDKSPSPVPGDAASIDTPTTGMETPPSSTSFDDSMEDSPPPPKEEPLNVEQAFKSCIVETSIMDAAPTTLFDDSCESSSSPQRRTTKMVDSVKMVQDKQSAIRRYLEQDLNDALLEAPPLVKRINSTASKQHSHSHDDDTDSVTSLYSSSCKEHEEEEEPAYSPSSKQQQHKHEVESVTSSVTHGSTLQKSQESSSSAGIICANKYVKFNSDRLFISTNGTRGLAGASGANGSHGLEDGDSGQTGKTAFRPEKGRDALDIRIQLSTTRAEKPNQVNLQVKVTDLFKTKSDSHELTLALSELPELVWSALGGHGGVGGVGGDGGNGAMGTRGANGSHDSPPLPGGIGGDGGDAGMGTGGADGGKGGRVRILVSKQDSFLLMKVHPCNSTSAIALSICGGNGGKAGSHGKPGLPGVGGKGGEPYTADNKTRKKRLIGLKKKPKPGGGGVGGGAGPQGRPGREETSPLEPGHQGSDGTFCIEVDGLEYSRRFDPELESFDLVGLAKLGNDDEFEFGSIVDVENIRIVNQGQMPLFANQNVEFSVINHDAKVLGLLEACQNAHLVTKTDICAGEQGTSEGQLSLVYQGEISTSAQDFDPIRRQTSFQLGATILDAPKHETQRFSANFEHFHVGPPRTVHYKFPVENETGIQGIQSTCPGEITSFGFSLSNVGLKDLGHETTNPRRLALRFYAPELEGEGVATKVGFYASLKESKQDYANEEPPLVSGALVGQGTMVEVPCLSAGQDLEAFVSLRFNSTVPLYSRLSLQVEVLLETLPSTSNENEIEEERPLFVVQRRQLTLVCEPSYAPDEDAHVVLVTSTATTKKQHESWLESLHKLGLHHETYSLSRHASLDPTVVLKDGISLSAAFADKLVVVLNDGFKMKPDKPDDVLEPLSFLPGGCIDQVSGFAKSTRWLIVDSMDKNSLVESMLSSDVLAKSEKKIPMGSIGSIKNEIKSHLEEEVSKGTILQDEMQVCYEITGQSTKETKQQAQSLAEWLAKHDTLRQYTVCYNDEASLCSKSTGKIVVHRGVCKSRNSAIVVSSADVVRPEYITSQSMLLALAQALPPHVAVERYCAALTAPDLDESSLQLYRVATVSNLIHEVQYISKAKLHVSDEWEDCFGTLGAFTDNLNVLKVIAEAKTDQDIFDRVSSEWSDLFGRLEAVAQSKDLRPRFNRSERATKRETQQALVDSVKRLRRQMRSVMMNDIIAARSDKIKQEVRRYLGPETSEREGSNWLRGLAFLHSTENTLVFGGAQQVKSTRLVELVTSNILICEALHKRQKLEELDRVKARSSLAQHTREQRETFLLRGEPTEGQHQLVVYDLENSRR